MFKYYKKKFSDKIKEKILTKLGSEDEKIICEHFFESNFFSYLVEQKIFLPRLFIEDQLKKMSELKLGIFTLQSLTCSEENREITLVFENKYESSHTPKIHITFPGIRFTKDTQKLTIKFLFETDLQQYFLLNKIDKPVQIILDAVLKTFDGASIEDVKPFFIQEGNPWIITLDFGNFEWLKSKMLLPYLNESVLKFVEFNSVEIFNNRINNKINDGIAIISEMGWWETSRRLYLFIIKWLKAGRSRKMEESVLLEDKSQIQE